MFQNGYRIRHMGRESGQILLNALFITDVRINLCKYRQLGTVKGGNMQS